MKVVTNKLSVFGVILMKQDGITRGSFNHNFLKQVIMRLDFQGVLQTEMECILQLVKPYLKQAAFDRYQEKIENTIEFNVELTTLDSEPVKKVSQVKVYSFTNENFGYSLDLSTCFVILKVNAIKYVDFNKYSKIFIDICNLYKDNIDFFTVKRFGLRKINFCFVKTLAALNKYFEQKYYNSFDIFKEAQVLSNIKQTNVIQDTKRYNIMYGIEQGELGENIAYKVTLDIDIYSEDLKTIETILFQHKSASDMNDKIFSIYIDAITQNLYTILSSENENLPQDLLGVDSNE